MTLNTIRVAVIGAGDFGRRHIATIAALPEFTLVAVADRNLSSAQNIASKYAAAAFGSFEEVLRETEIHAVVIATPANAHFSDVRRAVDHGIHVLVEKPIVVAADELDYLDGLPSELRRLILPGHISRYIPSFAALRQRMHDERIRSIRAVRYVPKERLAMHGEVHPALSAMVHDFDLIRALVSTELVRVQSEQAWVDPSMEHPQIVVVHLRFADGTIASVENFWTMTHSRRYVDARLEVSSDSSFASLSLPSGGVRFETAEGEYEPALELEGSLYGMPVGAMANQLRYFAAYTAGRGVEPSVTLEDALWSVRVALTVERQAGEQKTM